jgi:hypothetical protein
MRPPGDSATDYLMGIDRIQRTLYQLDRKPETKKKIGWQFYDVEEYYYGNQREDPCIGVCNNIGTKYS